LSWTLENYSKKCLKGPRYQSNASKFGAVFACPYL
jgi:hypothetical protein